jgi:hypothetical protein
MGKAKRQKTNHMDEYEMETDQKLFRESDID